MADKIKTGYEGTNVPDDFSIPPVGIEDIDRAIFTLFDSINFTCQSSEFYYLCGSKKNNNINIENGNYR